MNTTPIEAGDSVNSSWPMDPGLAGLSSEFSSNLDTLMTPMGAPALAPFTGSSTPPLASIAAEPPLACFNTYSTPLGQTTYAVAEGDTLDSIAAQHSLTRGDILLTAPRYAAYDPAPGDNFPLLFDAAHPDIAAERRQLAQEIAIQTDPERLSELISLDLDLTTSRAVVPGDMVSGLESDLISRRRGDEDFAELVRQQIYAKSGSWAAEGRTQEVFYPLFFAAETGDPAAFESVLQDQYESVSAATPTLDAIQHHHDVLSTFGPDDPVFQKLVESGTAEFLVERPRRAAVEVDNAFQAGGALGGAAKLRELTDPDSVDPFSAAEIFRLSEGTVTSIGRSFTDFSNRDLPRIFSHVSAAADSASRSELAMPAIERVAKAVPVDLVMPYIRQSVGQGDGVVLPLEITRAFIDTYADEETAERLTHEIHEGVELLKRNATDAAVDLTDTALPLIEPLVNWDASLGGISDDLKRQWLEANPELIAEVGGKIEKAASLGYRVVRAAHGLEQYQSKLLGLEVDDANFLQELSGWEGHSQLALLAGSSPQAVLESFRHGNVDMIEGRALKGADFYVPDPSWPTRMARNHAVSYLNPRPAEVGLSLFGVGTYLWGVVNHSRKLIHTVDAYGVSRGIVEENGWRNVGFLAMYGAGLTIEARQGLALARTGETVWAGAFKNHIRTFGWYNVLGTVNYAMHGDGRRAVALGTATVGTLMGSYSTELGLAKWLGRAGGPIATGLVLAGSAGLAGVDAWDQHKSAIRTEPYNERFLILSGLDPDIAAALSSNDGEGRGIGPKLEQVAEHLQVAPDALMDWVVQQDPQWVKRFAKSVGHIHVNGDGSLQERELPPNYGYYSGGGYPRSLQGLLRLNSALRDWAEQNEAPQ